MPTEPATLRTRRGERADARAELVRYGSARRYASALGCVLFGLSVGVATLPFPILHAVLPWLLPLLGVVGAIAILRVKGRIATLSGSCPACGAGVAASDLGTLDGEPVWLRCPGCGLPLELLL